MANKKGRKIKRTKRIFKKRVSTSQKVLKFIFIIVLILGLVFLGYSVGKPVLEFLTGDRAPSTSTPPTTTPTTPTQSSNSSSSSITTTEPVIETPDYTKGIVNYRIPTDKLYSENDFKAEVKKAKDSGYQGIEIVLLENGGKIYFKTENTLANKYEATVNGVLSAQKMVEIIEAEGLVPVARMSVLTDHIVSRAYRKVGYMFDNGEHLWIDDRAENGGKAWVSPFSVDGVGYIVSLAEEIAKSGFDVIYAEDFVFPWFRPSDVELLGQKVIAEDRYKVLISLYEKINDAAKKYDTNVVVACSAYGALTGSDEIFKPVELKDSVVSILISPENFDKVWTLSDGEKLDLKSETNLSKKVEKLVQKLLTYTSPYSVKLVFEVDKSSFSPNELNDIVKSLNDLGFENVSVN